MSKPRMTETRKEVLRQMQEGAALKCSLVSGQWRLCVSPGASYIRCADAEALMDLGLVSRSYERTGNGMDRTHRLTREGRAFCPSPPLSPPTEEDKE